MGADFYITGAMRSGTTYLAAILNSQDESTCIQDSTFMEIQGPEFSCLEEFTRLCNRINYIFVNQGLPAAELLDSLSRKDLYDKYCDHFRGLFGTRMIGFKSTMMTYDQILDRLAEGSKVILMTRSDTNSLLKSWIGLIDSSLLSSFIRLSRYYDDLNLKKIKNELSDKVLILDLSEIIENQQHALARVSEYLGFTVHHPGKIYDSFNRLRGIPFQGNSSSRDYSSLVGNNLISSLKRRYAPAEIRRYAKLLEKSDSSLIAKAWTSLLKVSFRINRLL